MNLWYYSQDKQQKGPIPESELIAMLQNGYLPQTTLAWRDGMEKWSQAKLCKELVLPVVTPPPLPEEALDDTLEPHIMVPPQRVEKSLGSQDNLLYTMFCNEVLPHHKQGAWVAPAPIPKANRLFPQRITAKQSKSSMLYKEQYAFINLYDIQTFQSNLEYDAITVVLNSEHVPCFAISSIRNSHKLLGFDDAYLVVLHTRDEEIIIGQLDNVLPNGSVMLLGIDFLEKCPKIDLPNMEIAV